MISKIPAEVPLMFFFLEKLGVIRMKFHRIDYKATWDLPTERVVPGAGNTWNDYCYTWEPNR